MVGTTYRVVAKVGAMVREIGSSMRGFMPPLRSPDGTFGTQRIQGKERDAQRKSSYPGD